MLIFFIAIFIFIPLTGTLCWNGNRAIMKRILISSLIISVVCIFGVVLEIQFQTELMNVLFAFNIVLSVSLLLSYVYFRLKRRALKVIYSVFVCIFILPVLVIWLLSESLGSDGYSFRKSLNDGQYTVVSFVSWSDNTKETVQIEIYKEIRNLPFLEKRVYESHDVNSYVENAVFAHGFIVLSMSGWNNTWTERVDVGW